MQQCSEPPLQIELEGRWLDGSRTATLVGIGSIQSLPCLFPHWDLDVMSLSDDTLILRNFFLYSFYYARIVVSKELLIMNDVSYRNQHLSQTLSLDPGHQPRCPPLGLIGGLYPSSAGTANQTLETRFLVFQNALGS